MQTLEFQTIEKSRKPIFLLVGSMLLVFSLVMVGNSLFARELSVGDFGLELSSLVMPVNNEEPEAETIKEIKPQKENKQPDLPMRKENVADVDEPTHVPEVISSKPANVVARPKTEFVLGKENIDAVSSAVSNRTSNGDATNNGINGAVLKPKPDEVIDEPPPTPKPVVKPTLNPTPNIPKAPVSGGVVNGKASRLVTPVYPPSAKAVRAYGAVNVQVTIDEDGNVISAKAVSGHALLKQAAENAAKQSKFTPTFLSGEKVKVTGVIVYNFSL